MIRPSALEQVKNILRAEWDPIGIGDARAARDEYDSNAGRVLSLLRPGASADALYRYLRDVETGSMGLDGDPERTRRIAEKLWGIELSAFPRSG